MYLQRFVLFLVVGLLSSTGGRWAVNAFTHCSSVGTFSWTSTCLRVAPDSDEPRSSSSQQQNRQQASSSESTKNGSGGGNDILNSPAFLSRKLQVLQSDIAKAEEELEVAKAQVQAGKAEWGAQLDELQREYQNIQERMKTQNSQGDTMATTQVVRKMLEVLDNYDRAFGVITPETDAERAIEAHYKEAYQMILSTFEKLGVEEVPTVGIEFDYELHQAVMQKPSEEYEEGIVCEEFQKGFRIGDTLVRAAMVAVAA